MPNVLFRVLLLTLTCGLASAAQAQTIDDDLLAAQMNYQRVSNLADKTLQNANLARQARQQAEAQLANAQRALEKAQAEQAAAENAERDAQTELGLARQRLDAAWGLKQQRNAQP